MSVEIHITIYTLDSIIEEKNVKKKNETKMELCGQVASRMSLSLPLSLFFLIDKFSSNVLERKKNNYEFIRRAHFPMVLNFRFGIGRDCDRVCNVHSHLFSLFLSPSLAIHHYYLLLNRYKLVILVEVLARSIRYMNKYIYTESI